jgi:hypothetical protein
MLLKIKDYDAFRCRITEEASPEGKASESE